jgi:fused signal recognition particle receptor
LSLFKKIKSALFKTRSFLGNAIGTLFSAPIDEETFDKLEKILYEADVGSSVTDGFLENIKKFLRKNPNATTEEILSQMKGFAKNILEMPEIKPLSNGSPSVFLIVGINGSGKTTSIAKLAHLFTTQGKKIMLVAGDTFRAGAIDQIVLWAKKLNVDIVKSQPGSDPSSVAFDGLTAAKNRGCDIVLVDTAGRLQNKTDLMQELEKIRRVCGKVIPGAPHEIILVLDATIGQNGVEQAKTFHQFTPLTGIFVTKLDGSAKGGIILPIYQELKIPVRWIGTGETIHEIAPFDAKEYVSALFENS